MKWFGRQQKPGGEGEEPQQDGLQEVREMLDPYHHRASIEDGGQLILQPGQVLENITVAMERGPPLADVLLFARPWGFELAEVGVPVHWWHGDADHIIPFDHGVHAVGRLPDAELHVLPGESHLGGLGAGEEILVTLLDP